MTVLSHLQRIAARCIVRDNQKTAIDRSVGYIQRSISGYFGAEVSDQIVFGSYSRNTNLPQQFDAKADVDLMVVFGDRRFRPQTYLDKLRRFTNATYSSSQIKQSHPTVQLDLNHIRFELVPALKGNVFYSEHQIPSPASDWPDWMGTKPRSFNADLSKVNQANSNLTKPLVRVLKYWNAQQGYPFASYELEKHIVENSYTGWGAARRLDSYFYEIVEGLPSFWFGPQWKRDRVARLQQAAKLARQHERHAQTLAAELEIKKVLKAA